MFATRRRGFPARGLLLVALGFAIASIVGGASSAVGALFFLPLLALKLMFMFFIFGTFMRFASGGFASPTDEGPAHGRGSSWKRREAVPTEPTQEEKDWAKARQAAREEIEHLFPDSARMPHTGSMDE